MQTTTLTVDPLGPTGPALPRLPCGYNTAVKTKNHNPSDLGDESYLINYGPKMGDALEALFNPRLLVTLN